jgi:hypothetical protein
LQKQILSQTKAIERYISEHQTQSNPSEAFALLQSLFALFKSEISMNLAMEKAVAQERFRRIDAEKSAFDTVNFFKEFGRMTHSRVESFDDVYDLVVTQFEKFRESKKSLIGTITELQSMAVELESEVTVRDERLQAAAERQSKQDETLKQLRSQLSEIESMKAELAESNQVIKKQRLAIQHQKQTVADLTVSNRRELEQQRSTFQRKLDLHDEAYQRERQKFKAERELKHLKEELAQSQLNHQAELIRIRKECLLLIEQKETELAQREAAFRRQELDFQEGRQQLEKLKETARGQEEQFNSNARELSHLKTQNQETFAANSQLVQANEELGAKVEKLRNRIRSIKASSAKKCRKLVIALRQMRDEHKQELGVLTSEVESKFLERIQSVEERLKS